MEDNAEEHPKSPPSPLSEVGSAQADNAETRTSTNGQQTSNDKWHALLQAQNESMMRLIATMCSSSKKSIKLPRFDPDDSDANPHAWCSTVDLCLTEKPLQGSELIIALSGALKGSASTWLSQVTYAGITWPQFKELFTLRFDCVETPAATLINVHNGRPKDSECLATYASRILATLVSRWKKLDIEEIAISAVIAHMSKFDDRMQRLAFTTEITTREKLQKELKALSFSKRKPTESIHSEDAPTQNKRMRPILPPATCYRCGKYGHKSNVCRSTGTELKFSNMASSTPSTSSQRLPASQYLANKTCYKCGTVGHFASQCNRTVGQKIFNGNGATPVTPSGSASGGRDGGGGSERRVELCYKNNPSGHLMNNGILPDRSNRIEDIYLRFYNGNKFDEYVDIRLSQAQQLLETKGFDCNRTTVLYSHGFIETAQNESVQVIVTAYLEARRNTNVVLLDWSNMAHGSYLINAARNTKKVGVAVAEQLNKLLESGLQLDKLHLIGHSLGSHVAGYTARDLKNNYNKTIRRLTALDPAFPCFYPDGVMLEHVTATDADFVDVIHTDAGGAGAPVRTGTVDFWPNGGKSTQPGCPRFAPIPLSDDNLCSHWRSWWFYSESVRTPKAFPASPADSYRKFKENPEPETGLVYMGVDCDTSARGSYYLTTNGQTPFGKGMDGIYSKRQKSPNNLES